MGLFSTLEVSASGLAAQRSRVEVLAQNIANSETTRTPEGGPYRRRRVVFESERQPTAPFGVVLAELVSPLSDPFRSETQGVRVAEISVDKSAPERRYAPHHRDADPAGYVDFPSFNPVEDMVDLTASVRSYQANLAVIASVKEMLNRTIEIGRG